MSLELRKESPDGVPNPPETHEAFFVNENGEPTLRGADGTIRPAVSVDGTPLVLNEQPSAPSTEALKGKLYSKDVSGGTEFFYLDAAGNEVQLTEAGAPAGGGGSGAFFDDALTNEVDFVITSGGGAQSVNSGIVIPILGDNSMVTVKCTYEGLGESGPTIDFGEFFIVFAWATAPTPPDAAFIGYGVADNLGDIGQSSGWITIFTGVELNASGEMVWTFTDTKSVDYVGRWKFAVSPGKLYPRDPTA